MTSLHIPAISPGSAISSVKILINRMNHKFEPLNLLLDLNADVNFSLSVKGSSSYIFFPLGFTMHQKLNETAEILLNYGADANYNNYGKNPLIIAIEVNNVDGLKLLLKAGAILKNIDISYWINFSYSKGFKEIAQTLIEAEASIYDNVSFQ